MVSRLVPLPPAFPAMRDSFMPAVSHIVAEAERKAGRPCPWSLSMLQQPDTGDMVLSAYRAEQPHPRRFLLASYGELVSGEWKRVVGARIYAAAEALMTVPFLVQRRRAVLALKARIPVRRHNFKAATDRHYLFYASLYEGG